MADYVSDAALLERFVNSREDAAFAALVQRHGPRVLGACRRILRDEHDAEDVFQATFLVLARKASAGIPWRDSVGGWLCAVALRLARNARSCTARKRQRETPFGILVDEGPGHGTGPLAEYHQPRVDPLADVARRELRQVLNDELGRLPEKYRAPLVLCYLEGKTNEEAAEQLGWPAGSMSRRLERARGLLRPRLARRGLSLPVLVLCAGLAAFGTWKAVSWDRGDLVTGQSVVAPFQPAGTGQQGMESDLTRIVAGHGSAPDWSVLARLARHSVLIADRIKKLDPGKNADRWQALAEEIRVSTEALSGAVQKRDDEAAVEAVRQLKASCVKCHVAIRD